MLSTRDPLQTQGHIQTESEGMEKDIPGKWKSKAGVAILVSDKIDFYVMDRSSKQKINMETQALNDTIDQIHLIDIYRTFHPKVAEYTFFSSAH